MNPFAQPGPRSLSPFVGNFDTVSKSLELLRQLDRQGRGRLGAEHEFEDLTPAVQVFVRNNTGSTLLPLSCVKLGEPVISAQDFPHTAAREPVFLAETPTATDNPFAIVLSGASGSNTKLLRAVVVGTTVCDVNFSDSSHSYATPAAGSTTLASAASGPVRVLKAYGSGTGVRRCVVLVDRQGTAAAALSPQSAQLSGAPFSLTTTGTLQDLTSVSVTVTQTGVYAVSFFTSGKLLIGNINNSVGTTPSITTALVRFLGSYQLTVMAAQANTPAAFQGSVGGSIIEQVTAVPFTYKVQAARQDPGGLCTLFTTQVEDSKLFVTRLSD